MRNVISSNVWMFLLIIILSEDFRMIVNLDMQYDIIDNFSDLDLIHIQDCTPENLKCGMMQLSK